MVQAEGWIPQLIKHNYLPPLFMAVDKSKQQAYLVQTSTVSNATSASRTIICSTGKKDGDKKKEGDLKTPEGIYFIVEKITSGLDYTEYGNTAFPLNYPNPIDRIRGKTGYGIWIHGRGTPLTPKITRGCVSLLNTDVDSLDQEVSLHQTPIIIAQNLVWSNSTQPESVEEVAADIRAWANAWRQGKESSQFYDPQLYALSSGQTLEQTLEKTLDQSRPYTWLDLRLKDLQIIEGPGYMVSVFTQLTLPQGDSGYRRLYWMQRENGWKIVGEEWVPQNLSFPNYVQVLKQEIQNIFLQADHWWRENKLHLLTHLYDSQARRGTDNGKKAITQSLQLDRATASNPFVGELNIAVLPQGLEATLTTAQGLNRKFVFHPGPTKTWRIISEDAVEQN